MPTSSHSTTTPSPSSDHEVESTFDIKKAAELIALGIIDVPPGLDESTLVDLLTRVRALRRRQLIRCLVRTIAADLANDEMARTKDLF